MCGQVCVCVCCHLSFVRPVSSAAAAPRALSKRAVIIDLIQLNLERHTENLTTVLFYIIIIKVQHSEEVKKFRLKLDSEFGFNRS